MKKEARLLLMKSVDSLVLSIDHFNGAWDRGRPETVLILLDRAFELLLKSAIIHRDGRIREPRAKETIGFAKCIRKCLTEDPIKCLTEDQAFTLQTINSLRDAAQHYLVDISEDQLYLYAQAGVTLYGDVLKCVFRDDLKHYLPARVLPISTSPPRDIETLMGCEVDAIRDLLRPRSRRHIEARSRLRAIAIIEDSLHGIHSQPGPGELNRMLSDIEKGKDWRDVFPGVASLKLETEGTGLEVSIRITKRDGAEVHLVSADSPDAHVVAVKRVNELDFYSLGANELAEKLGLSRPRTLALIWQEKVQDNGNMFKEVRIGNARFKRYSHQALDHLKKSKEQTNLDELWRAYSRRYSARDGVEVMQRVKT